MSLRLYDQHGRLQPEAALPTSTIPAVRGGEWRQSEGEAAGVVGHLYGIDRSVERRAARISFFLNPLVKGITGLLTSHVVGDEFTYGTLDDKRAQAVLEEMWSYNKLDQLAERIWLEYIIDGESALLLDTDTPANLPSRISLIDVDTPFELLYDTGRGVYGLETHFGDDPVVYDADEFVWTANDALWNDPRGWPVLMQAIPSCLSYIGLINSRLRAQDLLGRINAIYKGLYYPNHANAEAKYTAKTDRFRVVPRDGSVISLAIDAETGREESFEFTKSPNNAQDAEKDARLIRMLAATALNIPPTWLGDAEDTNRASAGEMNGPPLIAMKRRQSTFRSMMNGLFQRELLRRFGPDQTYLVRYTEPSASDPLTLRKRRKYVKAEMLEAPWTLPVLDDASLDELVKQVALLHATGDASRITRQELMGLDPALEKERLAAEEPKPKPTPVTLRTPPAPTPAPPAEEESTEEPVDE